MSSLGALNIHLSLDTIKFQQALSKSDQQTQKFVKNFTVDMDKAKNSARQFADRTTEYLRNIENASKNINTATKWNFHFGNIERVKSLATSFVDIADKSTELSNKLKLVTENETQHAKAMADVYDISMKTAQSTQAVSAIYSSFSQNAKELGINQQQVASVTETISKAVAISGASASEAQNALTQFSQTLLMGKMRSQEYNSIMTQTPAVLQAIARGLGVTMGQLKEMSDKGDLTADKMIKGLEKAKVSVDELFGKTASTVSGAMQNLSTATQKWVGELNDSLGISDNVIKVTQLLSENLDELAKIALTVGVAYSSWKFGTFLQGQYNSIKATQAEISVKHQKLAVLAQESQATYQTQLAAYQSIQTKQADVIATQAQVQAEQAKLRMLALSSASYAERKVIQTELQALDRISAELTQKQTFLDQQQTIAKKALNMAYRENAVAQSAFAVSTQASGVAMTAFRTITASVKAEMNALKVAMLSNPIMMGLTVLATAGSMLYMFATNTNEAKEASLRYADSIDQVRTNLEKMTAAQAAAEMVKVKRSIQEQEEALAKLRQEQGRLANSAQQTSEVIYDAFGGSTEIIKTAEELSQANDELTLKTAEVEEAQNKLNKTLEWQQQLQAHLPIQQLKDAFQEAYPNVDITKVNFDGFNDALVNFQNLEPSTSSSIANLAINISKVATIAMVAAQNMALINSAKIDVPQLSEKAQKAVGILKKKEEAAKLKAKGDHKGAARVEAEMSAESQGFTGIDAEEYIKQSISLSETQRLIAEQSKKSGGKPKKDKEAEKAKREAERNRENYLNQVTEMSQRLSGLKDEASDIALFGQTSQYQEVKKLTEDIALNAEKYKGYSTEGIAKLKALASQIDSETQKVAIAKFGFDNADKLKAMEFELTLLGKTRQEAELLQYNYQLDQEAAQLRVGMTQENIAKLDEELIKLKERRAEIQQQAEQKRTDPMEGINGAWNEIENEATNVADNVKNVTVNAFNSMSDALTSFVMTGKADFRSMAVSILKDISAMMIKMALFNAIKQGMSFMGYSDGGLVGGVNSSFAVGGYTGDGGKYTPAGIVHRGEYVITKEATARIGRGYLDYLNYGSRRGFATGGGVAVPNVPMLKSPMGNAMTSNNVSITINIDQNGNAESDTQEQAQNGKQLGKMIESKVLEVLATQRRAGGMFA